MDIISKSNQVLRRIFGLVPKDSPVRVKLAAGWQGYVQSRGSIEVVINDDTYRLLPKYRSFTPDYEKAVYQSLKRLIAKVDCFVDVGANFGLYSLLASRVATRLAPIVSIEASPFTYETFRSHLELNEAANRVVAMNFAVADASGKKVRFMAEAGTAGDPCARISADGTSGVEVSTMALDDLDVLRRSKHALVKIDVEGAELGVLQGARKTLAGEAAPILLLAVHPMFLPEFGTTPEAVYDELQRNGYQVLTENGQLTEKLEYAEYWCVPKTAREWFAGAIGFEAQNGMAKAAKDSR